MTLPFVSAQAAFRNEMFAFCHLQLDGTQEQAAGTEGIAACQSMTTTASTGQMRNAGTMTTALVNASCFSCYSCSAFRKLLSRITATKNNVQASKKSSWVKCKRKIFF
jgi:hypothetical protein